MTEATYRRKSFLGLAPNSFRGRVYGRHGRVHGSRWAGMVVERAYVLIANMRPFCSSQGSASGIAAAIEVTTLSFLLGLGTCK